MTMMPSIKKTDRQLQVKEKKRKGQTGDSTSYWFSSFFTPSSSLYFFLLSLGTEILAGSNFYYIRALDPLHSDSQTPNQSGNLGVKTWNPLKFGLLK